MLSLIYARSRDHCIGHKGRIPWHLPDEFAHFERTTMGKPIIMGRKTYEDHNCELAGRLNIVVTTQQNYQAAPGINLAPSLEAAIELGRAHNEELFVIGGVAIFCAALPLADTVYETVVEATIAGDTVLPDFDFSAWSTSKMECHRADSRHKFAYSIFLHKRK